jgi:hypothetical protein
MTCQRCCLLGKSSIQQLSAKSMAVLRMCGYEDSGIKPAPCGLADHQGVYS